jgi:hypothetical protein
VGFGPSGPLVDAAGFGRVASKAVTSSAIQGTSGVANPALLRGRTGDAALGPGGVRESDAFEAVTLRKRVAWVRELLPFAGVGLVRWDRHGCLSLTGAALAASESPTGGAAVSRREVSERIGLG